MNRSNRNQTPSDFLTTGPDYGANSARGSGSSRMPSMFPPQLPAGVPLNPREGDHNLQQLFRERLPGGPLGISSVPAPPHSLNQTQFTDNDAARNSGPRPPAADASPSFQSQWNLQAMGDESRLTQAEQKKALNRLEKQIYIPKPKWLTVRPNLYYRDNPLTSSIAAEKEKDEDRKRCAICLDDFEPKEVVTVTPCKHMFHEECIVPWVKSHGQCPVCRFAICERFRENAAPSSNLIQPDQFENALIAIIGAMEQAFASENMRRLV